MKKSTNFLRKFNALCLFMYVSLEYSQWVFQCDEFCAKNIKIVIKPYDFT